MRTNRFVPKGIIRSSGEHEAGDGACDEVINLRYEDGTMRPCGTKSVIANDTPFVMFYKHSMPGSSVYIGAHIDGDTGSKIVSTVSLNGNGGYEIGETIASFGAGDNIDIKFINNIAIISSDERGVIYSYVYVDGEYKLLSDGTLPDIMLDFSRADFRGGDIQSYPNGNVSGPAYHNPDFELSGVADKYAESGNVNVESVVSDIKSGLNYIRHIKDKHRTEGYVGVCANFTLFDGSETKPSQPVWFYLGGAPKIQFGYGEGNTGNRSMFVSMPTSSLSVWINSLGLANPEQYEKYSDVIKSVNIYCTYPHSGIDIDKTFDYSGNGPLLVNSVNQWSDLSKQPGGGNIKYTYAFGPNGYGAMKGKVYQSSSHFSFVREKVRNVETEMFYCQKRVRFSPNIEQMREVVELDFSERMLTFDTMPVENSGYVKRYGKMMTYNSRLHLFDITNTLMLPHASGTHDALFGQSWTRSSNMFVNREFASEISNLCQLPDITTVGGILIIKSRKEGSILTSKRNIDVTTFTSTKFADQGSRRYIILRYMPDIVDIDTISVDLYFEANNTTYKWSTSPNPSKSSNFAYVEAISDPNARPLVDFYTTVPDDDIVVSGPSAYNPNAQYRYPVSHFNEPLPNSTYYGDAYEYACIDVTDMYADGDMAHIDRVQDSTTYRESDTVVVSSQNNPIFFSPENSYRIGGNVRSVVPNSGEISDVQYGQYPLSVFTDNGVYAMQQGSGKILYATVNKIAEDVIDDGCGALPTTYGISFISNGGVFLMVGRRCWRISAALDGPPDYDIRNCEQYKAAHMCHFHHLCAWTNPNGAIYTMDDFENVGPGTIVYNSDGVPTGGRVDSIDGNNIVYGGDKYAYTESMNVNLLYDIEPYLSGDFRDEIEDASKVTMAFDRTKAELLISISDKPYTYAYSFVEKQWHKILEVFDFSSDSIVLMPSTDGRYHAVCDITKEHHDATRGMLVHLQTRCLKFGTESYKAVHRCIGRVNINNTHNYEIPNGWITGMYLYASRDMRNWSMVGLNQARGYADIYNINKTSAHFKYYLISLGGRLLEDSEITCFDTDVQYRYEDKER